MFYEISYRLYAYDNVITGNGFAIDPGNWGVQAGISLSSSPFCVIERNLLVGNREGFAFREQYRTTPIIGDRTERPVWNHDEIIRNNIIAFNRDGQIFAWFNQRDARHLPSETPGKVALKPEEIKKDENGQPLNLTLEDLNIRFSSNCYFSYPQQGMIKWGPSFSKIKREYPGIVEFQKDLKIDTGGKSIDPMFSDLRTGDFRISKKNMTILKGNYPRGTVPGVTLGILQ